MYESHKSYHYLTANHEFYACFNKQNDDIKEIKAIDAKVEGTLDCFEAGVLCSPL